MKALHPEYTPVPATGFEERTEDINIIENYNKYDLRLYNYFINNNNFN